MKKSGKIKFADHSKGYGYIVADDAASPAETLLFEAGNLSSDIDMLVPGTEVIFEVDPAQTAPQATNVETA